MAAAAPNAAFPCSLRSSTIKSIRHRGLRRLYERADASRIDAKLRGKVQRVLTALGGRRAEDMDLPGHTMHPLTGKLRGFWSVRVSGNWRVIFRIEGGYAGRRRRRSSGIGRGSQVHFVKLARDSSSWLPRHRPASVSLHRIEELLHGW